MKVVQNNYLFMTCLSFYGYREAVALLLFNLSRSKRYLLQEDPKGECPKIVKKMTVVKKMFEIFLSDSFEARKEGERTEFSLF
jgi:hypothetical protein